MDLLCLIVAGCNGLLHDLVDPLKTGELACAEEFEFRPHLTRGGPIPEPDLNVLQDKAQVAWRGSGHAKRFTLDEIVFLWWNADHRGGEWHRLWCYNLRTKGTAATKAARAAFTNRTS